MEGSGWGVGAGGEESCFFSLSESFLFLGSELSHVQYLSASARGSACVSLNLPLRGFPDDEDSMVPVQGLWVRSLIGELTSHMPCGTAKNFLKINLPLLSLGRTPVTGFRTTLIQYEAESCLVVSDSLCLCGL